MNFDPLCITLQTQALTLACSRVLLDEETFGAPIACLDRIEVRECAGAARDYQQFSNWCDAMRIMLCSARIPQSHLVESMFLEERGFRFIELAYRPHLKDLQSACFTNSEIEVLPAAGDDRRELAALAERTFQVGRFHQDVRIGTAAADRRYGQWIWRAFDNPRQQVLKCLLAGQIIGFFVVETHGPGECFWSLVGLAPEFTGRGLGYKTWTAMLRYHQSHGVGEITTRISSHNIAVMNLYVRLGFRFSEPQISLHWRPEGSGILGQ